MSLSFYFDQHINFAVAKGLRSHGVEVITAFEDGTADWADPELMDRASELKRILFSQDIDMLAEAARRQRQQEEFSGLIFVRQGKVEIGACIQNLALLARRYSENEFTNRVQYLPLKKHA